MIICMVCGVCISACHKAASVHPDQPYLAPGSEVKDVVFHSAALKRDMPYRVFLPAHVDPGAKLPVVYLLHGGNGGFRDWSNYSTVSTYAAKGLIVVMPEGEFSYYMMRQKGRRIDSKTTRLAISSRTWNRDFLPPVPGTSAQ